MGKHKENYTYQLPVPYVIFVLSVVAKKESCPHLFQHANICVRYLTHSYASILYLSFYLIANVYTRIDLLDYIFVRYSIMNELEVDDDDNKVRKKR